jgi:hypothetical protein
VTRAGPGDFIYLRGGAEYTHANAWVSPVHGAFAVWAMPNAATSGAPGTPITVTSYPGEQAVIRGEFVQGGHIGVRIGRSHWRVHGLRLIHGTIQIGHSGSGLGIRDVHLTGNHVSDVIASPGNFGLITVTGQHTQGGEIDHALDPTDILIEGNTAQRLWGYDRDGAVSAWYGDVWIEHHACFMGQKWNRDLVVRDNVLSECAAAIYFKWESPGVAWLTGNTFGPHRTFGRSRALDVRCSNNTVGAIELTTFPITAVCMEE